MEDEGNGGRIRKETRKKKVNDFCISNSRERGGDWETEL